MWSMQAALQTTVDLASTTPRTARNPKRLGNGLPRRGRAAERLSGCAGGAGAFTKELLKDALTEEAFFSRMPASAGDISSLNGRMRQPAPVCASTQPGGGSSP